MHLKKEVEDLVQIESGNNRRKYVAFSGENINFL